MMNTGTGNPAPFIPHDVARMVACDDVPLFRAWRERLGMTVEFIATAAGLSAEEVGKLDNQSNGFSLALLRAAEVMNLDFDQLIDVPG